MTLLRSKTARRGACRHGVSLPSAGAAFEGDCAGSCACCGWPYKATDARHLRLRLCGRCR